MRKSIYLICNENNTKMEQKTIKIADLEVNRGQIDGLPKNPRTIKDENVSREERHAKLSKSQIQN